MPLSSPDPLGSQPGLQRDVRRAREGAFATTAELREFVQNLRGKSPQEVLGAVANSGLAQGLSIATVGTVMLIAVLTVGPYLLITKTAPAVKKETAVTEPLADARETAAPTDQPAPASKNAASNAQQTLDKMGESETKQADPKVNPLDNLDDLLDTKK